MDVPINYVDKSRSSLILIEKYLYIVTTFSDYFRVFIFGLARSPNDVGSNYTTTVVRDGLNKKVDSLIEYLESFTLTIPQNHTVTTFLPLAAFSKVQDGKILLAGYNSWQVWDVEANVLLAYNEEDMSQNSFNFMSFAGDTLAACTRMETFVWSISQNRVIHKYVHDEIISSLYLDDKFVIIGDASGVVIARSLTSSTEIKFGSNKDTDEKSYANHCTNHTHHQCKYQSRHGCREQSQFH